MMADNKRRKYDDCTICGDEVIELREINAANDLEDLQVLERIRQLNGGDFDESKISTFIACKTCRDESENAYEFVRKCRALMSGQPSEHSKLQNLNTQTETSGLIIIVNQMPKQVIPVKLKDIFSEHGRIVNFYLEKNDNSMEKFAHITFSSEDEALKVMNAARNKELRYFDEPLVVTRVSEDNAPIHQIPDVCLSEIFLRLDQVQDKVRIGKVCKRWKEVLTRSWSNIEDFSDTIEKSDIGDELISVVGLTSILKGCGHFLKRMKLDNYNCSVERIFLISKYCKNLENLQLELNCEADTGDYVPALLSIFQQCTKLRRIYIFRLDRDFDYNYLQYLPEEILEIHLDSMDPHTRPSIDLTKFQDLKALALWNFKFEENTVRGIGNLMNLEYLSFDGPPAHPSNVREVLNLKMLKWLDIPECGIDDAMLTRIFHENRNLEHLDISGNPSITDQSFQYVTCLSKLKTLYMKDLSEVTAADLPEMGTLEELDVEGCSSIVDWTLIMLIETCPKLNCIYAAGVATWRFIINAEETIDLSFFPRGLEIFADQLLARRWSQFPKYGKNLRVNTDSRESKNIGDEWRGWYGDSRTLA